MTNHVQYTKTTLNSRKLLDHGMALVTYCEIEDDRVLRVVQIYESGEVLKDRVGRPINEGMLSVREIAPLPEHNWEGSPAHVEWSTREEFEEAWARARLMGET